MVQGIMVEQLSKIFVVFFVVIEPISPVPLFGALTRGGGRKYRRVTAVKSVLLSAGIFFAVCAERRTAFTHAWHNDRDIQDRRRPVVVHDRAGYGFRTTIRIAVNNVQGAG